MRRIPREQVTQFGGTLVTDTYINNGPNGVGPDWADVVSVVPTESVKEVTIVRQPGQIPVIKVPLPTAEERLAAKQAIGKE